MKLLDPTLLLLLFALFVQFEGGIAPRTIAKEESTPKTRRDLGKAISGKSKPGGIKVGLRGAGRIGKRRGKYVVSTDKVIVTYTKLFLTAKSDNGELDIFKVSVCLC
jgi:hypothetical protein